VRAGDEAQEAEEEARGPRSPLRPPAPVAAGEVSLVPKWEGDAAREVEAGAFDVEDGPVVVTAEEEGELAASKLERETEGAVANELR
jgi:hypothetical protein